MFKREVNMTNFNRRTALAFIGGTAATAGLAAPALAMNKTIKVGALRFTSHSGSFIAFERGYFAEAGLEVPKGDPALARILDRIKQREAAGYSYDTAQGSFELLARDELGQLPDFFEVKRYRVTVERRKNKYNKMVSLSEAVVVVKVGGKKMLSVSESMDEAGTDLGPVNALAKALAKDLGPYQRLIEDIKLVDFKVRITQGGTEATTRVIIDSEDGQGRRWSTCGVSANIIDASFEALLDAMRWKLVQEGAQALAAE
jgi:2-isopropylmalate synthase